MPYDPINESESLIDVRPIPHGQRHALIFGVFEKLGADEALVLVNDHDPRPLHHNFQTLFAGTFTWNYLDQGPEVWRVRIGKVASSGCCGGCGGAGH